VIASTLHLVLHGRMFMFQNLINIKAFNIYFVIVCSSFQSLCTMKMMIYRHIYVLTIIVFDYILRQLFTIRLNPKKFGYPNS
jgi:hypothetical protein